MDAPKMNQPFAHRANADGTYDSICRTCFRTIATVLHPDGLESAEKTHVCDPRDVFRVQSVVEHSSVRDSRKRA